MTVINDYLYLINKKNRKIMNQIFFSILIFELVLTIRGVIFLLGASFKAIIFVFALVESILFLIISSFLTYFKVMGLLLIESYCRLVLI